MVGGKELALLSRRDKVSAAYFGTRVMLAVDCALVCMVMSASWCSTHGGAAWEAAAFAAEVTATLAVKVAAEVVASK